MLPTKQQIDLVSKAAKIAASCFQALSDLNSFMAFAGVSPSTSGVFSADWTHDIAGSLQGFDPAQFNTFIEQAQLLQKMIADNNNTMAVAFVTMSEYNRG